jgi:branched-chain amino acid aminotransferase
MNAPPLDDRDGVIWYNGELVPWREMKTHVLTHSLHYGNAVFEGERVYNGKVFKLHEHSARLVKSGELCAYSMPFSAEEIAAATKLVVEKNKIESGYVRPIAWRGSEVIGVSAKGTKVHVAVAAFPWPSYYSEEAQKKGIRLGTSRWKRPSPDSAPTASKCAGLYVICTLARDEAAAAGFDDAFMLDYRGQIAEATGANIFFGIGGELHTPTPDCFLNGITRQTAIDLARKRGIKVVERAIFPDELPKMEEVFITGTAVEITPIRLIDTREYAVGPITKQVQADYAALVRA